jgi:transposase
MQVTRVAPDWPAPTSALSLWFHERVQRLGGRMRKTIIVALARKLLIALWQYTTAGVVIEGGGDEGATGDDLTPSART